MLRAGYRGPNLQEVLAREEPNQDAGLGAVTVSRP